MPEELSTADKNRLIAQEALVHLDALDKDPHFAWFMRTVLEHARDEERDKALNVSLPADQAEQARWQHDMVKRLCDKPKTLRAMYAKQATPS